VVLRAARLLQAKCAMFAEFEGVAVAAGVQPQTACYARSNAGNETCNEKSGGGSENSRQ